VIGSLATLKMGCHSFGSTPKYFPCALRGFVEH
jgi:hypothetical protein